MLLAGLPLIPITEPPPPGCDPALHEVALQVTDSLHDWALRFLDACFVFILNQDSGSQQHTEASKERKADSESRASEYFFQCALEVFFMQLGDELLAAALNKVANFCFTNLLVQQQAQLGLLVTALAAVAPASVTRKLLPLCFRILLETRADDRARAASRTPRTPGSAADPRTPGAKQLPPPGMVAPTGRLPGTPGTPQGAARAVRDGEEFALASLSELEMTYHLALLQAVVAGAGAEARPSCSTFISSLSSSTTSSTTSSSSFSTSASSSCGRRRRGQVIIWRAELEATLALALAFKDRTGSVRPPPPPPRAPPRAL